MGRKTVAEYDANFRAKRRSALATIKLERGCADCGYDADPAALDFDHVGENKFNKLSAMLCRGWGVILDEIEKCEVVCANCHRIRTANRNREVARDPTGARP